jgi:RNA polymerase sigma-70 factor (ECF subfamily)
VTVSDPPTSRPLARDDASASLEDLLERVADGEESALRSFYERTSRTVFGLVSRIVRDRSEAEDALTDAYVQVWREAGRFDRGAGSALAWVTMLARTRAIDRWRARARRDARADDWESLGEQRLCDPDACPVERSDGRERAQAVRRAVAALPFEQRRLVEAAFFSGLTHTELAESFGQPLGTVKTRIRAALAALREALESLQGEQT